MYSSLDRIDIVAENEGQKLYVQTDHRDANEIDAEPELSILFLVTRLLNPTRMAEPGVIRYAAAYEPPTAFKHVLALGGAELEIMGENAQVPRLEGPRMTLAEVADEAFGELARRVAAREQRALDESLLEYLEKEAYAQGWNQEDDEIGYWTAIVELAAVTGELIRARHGGHWIADDRDMATIPFVFNTDNGALINVAGKSERFVSEGPNESPRQLLVLADAPEVGNGPILATLKPSTWSERENAVCEPILERADNTGADVPLIVYGEDQPNTFGIFFKDGEREKNIDELRALATANLAKMPFEVHDMQVGDLPTLLVVEGGYFASEKLLDRDFMRSLHTRIGSDLLAAGVPCKGLLLVTNGIIDPQVMAQFMAICAGRHAESGAHALSPTPLLVQDGEVVGLIQSQPEPPKKKRGFFSRLFH